MQDLLRRYGPGLSGLIVLLVAFWLVMLVIVPNITLFEQSFRPYLPVVEIGGPRDTYSFNNYAKVFDGNVETSLLGITFEIPVHVKTFSQTIWYSMVVTVICFALAYPLAYYMSKIVAPKTVPTLLLLLFVPLWVSEVLRAFAWWIILAFKGPLNAMLLGLGLIEDPIRWTNMGYTGVMVGLVYTYVLFMLFPIYNAISSLDTNQIEAADDLGAPWWKIHWRIVLPHAKPWVRGVTTLRGELYTVVDLLAWLGWPPLADEAQGQAHFVSWSGQLGINVVWPVDRLLGLRTAEALRPAPEPLPSPVVRQVLADEQDNVWYDLDLLALCERPDFLDIHQRPAVTGGS